MSLQVPEDVLLIIFDLVSAADAMSLEQVCISFRDAGANRAIWLKHLKSLEHEHSPSIPFAVQIDAFSTELIRSLVRQAVIGRRNWCSATGPRVTSTETFVLPKEDTASQARTLLLPREWGNRSFYAFATDESLTSSTYASLIDTSSGKVIWSAKHASQHHGMVSLAAESLEGNKVRVATIQWFPSARRIGDNYEFSVDLIEVDCSIDPASETSIKTGITCAVRPSTEDIPEFTVSANSLSGRYLIVGVNAANAPPMFRRTVVLDWKRNVSICFDNLPSRETLSAKIIDDYLVHIIRLGVRTTDTALVICTDLRNTFSYIPKRADASRGCIMMDITSTFPALTTIMRPSRQYAIECADLLVHRNHARPPTEGIRISIVCRRTKHEPGNQAQASPHVDLSVETYTLLSTGGALDLDLNPEFDQEELVVPVHEPYSSCSIQHSYSGRIMIELVDSTGESGRNSRRGIALNFSDSKRLPDDPFSVQEFELGDGMAIMEPHSGTLCFTKDGKHVVRRFD